MIARSTLRLQLHEGYTFDNVRGDVPYFARLGVTHLYLSPISQSSQGSTHGYDVVDHACIDSARGGEAAFRAMALEARQAGMGLLIDIVPNHMATNPDNRWWWDVLQRGRHGRWAQWFDIDWDSPGMQDKILAPFLEKDYSDALASGDISLQHDDARGFHIAVHGVPYPLAESSWTDSRTSADLLAEHDWSSISGRQRLHELLQRQHYKLASWRSAAREINWRRFFEVSGLIGVRVERDDVFDAVHDLPLKLYAEGLIDGLRIDHVDGLAQPLDYCRRLYAAMEAAGRRRPISLPFQRPWIVVEKILAPGETLDERWAVGGTTGYDFAADVGALLHDPASEAPLFAEWAQIAQDSRRPQEWLEEARQEMLERHFVAERNALLTVLRRMTVGTPGKEEEADAESLPRVLDALLVDFPTYRTYVEGAGRAPEDQYWFDRASRGAASRLQIGADSSQADWLAWLDRSLGRVRPESADSQEAVRRFQQLTPPLAAKALEDTVFYRYGCLLSRNEVGSDPAVFALDIDAFHRSNAHRAERAPEGLLATATHDHKRGEDVRARLSVLSEIPGEWLRVARRWMDWGSEQDADKNMAPFRYMLLQMLVGAWPPDLSADDTVGVNQYLGRLSQWAVKGMREGKQFSSWFEPNERQERAITAFLDEMAPGRSNHSLLMEIEKFARQLEPGAIGNGLIQAALRLTSPGIPDLYQGTEFRDFSLVDPDNRRPVDFKARAAALAKLHDPSVQRGERGKSPVFRPGYWHADAWKDGRVKQALIACLLQLRRERADAFSGGYLPLSASGRHARSVLAFARGDDIVVAAGIKCASRMREGTDGMPQMPRLYWGDDILALPGSDAQWHDVLRGRSIPTSSRHVRVADLLGGFPLAVLCRQRV